MTNDNFKLLLLKITNLELRINELEDLISKQNIVFSKCNHDWSFYYDTTIPYRQCEKCYKYESFFTYKMF